MATEFTAVPVSSWFSVIQLMSMNNTSLRVKVRGSITHSTPWEESPTSTVLESSASTLPVCVF